MKTLLRGLGGVAKITFGIVGAIIVLIIVIAVAVSAGSKTSSGPTKSPALVSNEETHKASAPARPQTFKGSGSENIGTINVPTESTLHWTCESCASANFIVTNSPTDGSQIGVNSINTTTGQTVIEAGTYHAVSINTEGQGWTITINPGT